MKKTNNTLKNIAVLLIICLFGISAHAKEVHGYTDEQLKDPEMVKKVKAVIKEE